MFDLLWLLCLQTSQYNFVQSIVIFNLVHFSCLVDFCAVRMFVVYFIFSYNKDIKIVLCRACELTLCIVESLILVTAAL